MAKPKRVTAAVGTERQLGAMDDQERADRGLPSRAEEKAATASPDTAPSFWEKVRDILAKKLRSPIGQPQLPASQAPEEPEARRRQRKKVASRRRKTPFMRV